MYCGNNKNNPDLLKKKKKLGSRYACFKKGVGIGLNLPVDPSFKKNYTPIIPLKIYCGTARNCPVGYTRLGTRTECLRKGVGVGKSIKSKKKKQK